MKNQPPPPSLLVALICVGILFPLTAHANPVMIRVDSFIAFGVVVTMAMIVEAGIVALILLVLGMEPLRTFLGFLGLNTAVFLFLFCPLLSRESMSLPMLELMVVGADALAIQGLSKLASMQGDSYSGVSWRSALMAAVVGNAVSFFVGVIANGAPWVDHGVE